MCNVDGFKENFVTWTGVVSECSIFDDANLKSIISHTNIFFLNLKLREEKCEKI